MSTATDGQSVGWVLHGLTRPAQASIEHVELGLDGALFDFLRERLCEELDRARAGTGRGPVPATEPWVSVLEETLQELSWRRLPDDVSLQLLLRAFRSHVDFRSRWATPDQG